MNPKQLYTIALILSAHLASTAQSTNDVTGQWHGTLNTGQAELRLLFHISKSSSGVLSGKLDSIDQGARGIPVETVSVKDKTLRMEVKAVNGTYEGTLDAVGTKATGEWSQGPSTLPLTLVKGQEVEVTSESAKLSPADQAANKLAAEKIAGTWNGTLVAGTTSLRLRVNITRTTAGAATGTMDSLDQGAMGIPLSAITLKDGKVRFEARGIGGVYEGTLDTGNSALTGQWRQGSQPLPLDLKRAGGK